jgi:hypothetical protein
MKSPEEGLGSWLQTIVISPNQAMNRCVPSPFNSAKQKAYAGYGGGGFFMENRLF